MLKSDGQAVSMMHVFLEIVMFRKVTPQANSIFFYKELLPGHEGVPHPLLSDPAYPLLPYVMRKFNHCTTNEQVVFNQMLGSARNQVGCAFWTLKVRWRILLQSIDANVKNVPNIILSCLVLHNYCEKRHVSVDQTSSENIVIEQWRFVNKIDKFF